MDPTSAHLIAEALAPVLALLAMLGVIPVILVFITKYFKLRTRELFRTIGRSSRSVGVWQ